MKTYTILQLADATDDIDVYQSENSEPDPIITVTETDAE